MRTNPADAFAANVARMRAAKNLTVRALGARAGLSGSFISQVETGSRRPRLDTMEQIARALRTTVQSLLNPPQ
jgi:transcriptional regulator with XRE-family HTH domain